MSYGLSPPEITFGGICLLIHNKHFVFCHITDHVVIDQSLLCLTGIHQALFADTVHHPWNTVRDLVDPIDGRVGKYVLRAARVLHVRIDVVLAFRPVERWHRTVDIDPLPYRGVSLQLRLAVPEFCLSGKHQGHRTLRVKLVVQHEAELLEHFLIEEVRLVEYADHLLLLDSLNDLDRCLQLALGICK